MNVKLNLRSMYSLVKGNPGELSRLEDNLREWSLQFDVSGKGRQVYIRDGGVLFVMAGALISLIESGVLEAKGQAPGAMFYAVDGIGGKLLHRAGKLRWYQGEAVDACLQAPWRRGIIEAPTGSGKTHISAGIIASGLAAGLLRWVYLCPSKGLAAQTSASFEKVIPGMLEALCSSMPEGGKVTCGGFTSAPPDEVAQAQGMIIDECHLSASPTRLKAIAVSSAQFRIGLSATPLLRQDAGNALVVGAFGPVIYSIGMKVLQDEGHLANGRVTTLEVKHD